MAQQIIRSIGSDGKEVLSNILDKDTGKLIEFKEVSEYYDGTPMSDDKLDIERYLYIKNNGKYYLRVLDNPNKFLEKDTMLDMRNISNTEILLLKMGYYKGVKLNGYYSKGDTPAPIEYYLSNTSATDDGGSVIEVGGVKFEHKFVNEINVLYYGCKRNDATFSNNLILEKVFAKAIENSIDIIFPGGTFYCIDRNFPFRQQIVSSLLDCKNITIKGVGGATVLKTISVGGADVIQANGLKNCHFRDFKVTATVTGSLGAGSNGVSVTNGFDNVTFLNIIAEDLDYIDKGNYLDGGKAFTLQSGLTTQPWGTLTADIYAKNCAYGFGADLELNHLTSDNSSIKIDVVAEKCFRGVVIACPASTVALNNGFSLGMDINARTINCQQDVCLSRTHGVNVNCQIVTTESINNLRLNWKGTKWKTTDNEVIAFLGNYFKNSQINIYGNKKQCDYKARMGGSAAGSSGQFGTSDNNNVFLDIAGNSITKDVEEIDFGGNILTNTNLYISNRTATILPNSFYNTIYNNNIFVSSVNSFNKLVALNRISLNFASNTSLETGRIYLEGLKTLFQGKGSSAPNTVIAGLSDYSGTFRLGILNGNGIVVDGINSASPTGEVYKGRLAVYDVNGVLLGFIPLYNNE